MSLPPVLLQRLAQRGLVQRQGLPKEDENEEVIAENYDDIETEGRHHRQSTSDDYQHPPQYDTNHDNDRKQNEDNYWLTQMKARMGEAGTYAGYKGCPNKYNIWHKCTLYCINRWAEGIPKPNSEYMKRYKRLIRKYPLPKDWVEMYDPGCGCYYFACEADNVVSWLPPTHPKSQITKSAAAIRKHMEESNGSGSTDSDEEALTDDDAIQETAHEKHQREVNEIINATMKPTSPNINNSLDNHEFPSLEEAIEAPTVSLPRKQKTRDLNRILSKQRKERNNDDFCDGREKDRESYSKRLKDDTEHSQSEENSAYSADAPWSDDLPAIEDNQNSTSDE